MKPNTEPGQGHAFTLLELLLTIAIIGLLMSLLLPSLQRGQVHVRSLQCKSNLHQLGLGMLSFAQAHEDKFPVQVSTNQGGSSEFIDAGNALSGPFYFAYKHFLPLAAEIETPKLLVCPADHRPAAASFLSLRNTNLSYFVGANPQFGASESILSGDRNLTPLSNSIARLRGSQRLKWSAEMHQYKGNVLFADGHVELLNNTLSQPAGTGKPYTSLVIPSVPVPVIAGAPGGGGQGGGIVGGGGGGAIQGGNRTVSYSSGTNLAVATNASTRLTNLTINAGPPTLPPWPFTGPGPGGYSHPYSNSSAPTLQSNLAGPITPVSRPLEKTEEDQVEAAHQEMVDTGRDLVKRGATSAYILPWWLIVGLLLACLCLLHRAYRKRTACTTERRPAPYHYRNQGGQ